MSDSPLTNLLCLSKVLFVLKKALGGSMIPHSNPQSHCAEKIGRLGKIEHVESSNNKRGIDQELNCAQSMPPFGHLEIRLVMSTARVREKQYILLPGMY